MILRIKEIVETELNVNLGTRSRVRRISDAKKIFCKLARERTNYSLAEIGKVLNNDHATVLHNIKQANNLLETDKVFKNDFARCEAIIKHEDDMINSVKIHLGNGTN
jgi:chromosomal replication initiation ATPase DnaA